MDYCIGKQCDVGQGDCDSDSECKKGLICGSKTNGKYGDDAENCREFDQNATSTADCCGQYCLASVVDDFLMKCFLVGIWVENINCTPSSPCDEGRGDCVSDSDCKGSLVCGSAHGDNSNNCQSFHSSADPNADCCSKS